MDFDQRATYMKKVVLPKMRDEFKAWESEHAHMNCATCHGAGASEGSFEMPNPRLPKLTMDLKEEMKEEPEATKFMMERVVPEMAKLLDEPAYDPKTGKGFGCFDCHVKRE